VSVTNEPYTDTLEVSSFPTFPVALPSDTVYIPNRPLSE